jgi:protease II
VQDSTTKRTNRLWRWTRGAPTGEAELVYEEADPQFSIGLSLTRSRRFLLLAIASETTAAARFLPAAEPQGAALACPGRTRAGALSRHCNSCSTGGWKRRCAKTGHLCKLGVRVWRIATTVH